MERGPAGNILAGEVTQLEPDHARFYLNLGTATVTPSNPQPFTGGNLFEDDNAYRAVYTVRYANAVYVLHAFEKKSKKGIATPKAELDLIEKRLKDLIKEKEGRQ